jgi:hypothetical protein
MMKPKIVISSAATIMITRRLKIVTPIELARPSDRFTTRLGNPYIL